jgi:hypothetical protein
MADGIVVYRRRALWWLTSTSLLPFVLSNAMPNFLLTGLKINKESQLRRPEYKTTTTAT